MRLVSLFVLLLITGSASSQDLSERIARIEDNLNKIAQMKSKKAETITKTKIDETKPYVLFVGRELKTVPGYQSVRDDNYMREGVFLVMPGRKFHVLYHDDHTKAHENVLMLSGQGVSQPAVPFGLFAKRRIVDDNIKVSGRWPSMGRLAGMERYQPFELTQSIFKYVNNPNGIIRGVNRSATEAKYQVPGGLLGVSGWRSELYRTKIRAVERPAFIGVKNDSNNYQNEVAFLRSYPDGAEFDDVLINISTNRVFEHRVAQKVDGKWERFVAYRDSTQAPPGYVAPRSKDCSSCHKDAASGGYGVGLAPGGDEIFSDPFASFPNEGEERQIPLR